MAAGRKGDVEGARYAVQAVDKMSATLQHMLDEASRIKKSTGVEPALTNSDLEEVLRNIQPHGSEDPRKSSQFCIIETSIRDIFNELLASYSIDDPAFVRIWNLFDIISILADTDRCDPPLLFHLIEELLDSQTVSGCRRIFDYLESRRERITAKDFQTKNLIILRSCNELLRRLSRAEDTAFCGRVFIFMFQSFPLGDKSSVNLRGEYHVENTTIFDEGLPSKASPDAMQLDDKEPASQDEKKNTPAAALTPKIVEESKLIKGSPFSKGVSFNAKVPEKAKDPDTMYPIFWSLQHSFNQPKRLFDPSYLSAFKTGLEDTMVMFRTFPNAGNSTPARTQSEKQNNVESRGTKRKRSSSNDDLASTFNPKYLTSRDLFELEISDISFRRHVLVQALIILDFLLSLSPKAKEKLAPITPQNKSVMYAEQSISEEDTKWALNMKRQISEYMKAGADGPFFIRMVETVLSRDKNWVRWKMESCPSIQKPAIEPKEVAAVKTAAKKHTRSKLPKPEVMGSLDLKFLQPGKGGLDRLKDPNLYKLPSLAELERKIADDEFNMDMTTDPKEKEMYLNQKASKTWRVLRIASKTKLALFDKIDDSSNIKKIFEEESTPFLEVEDVMEIENSKDSVVVEDATLAVGGDAVVEQQGGGEVGVVDGDAPVESNGTEAEGADAKAEAQAEVAEAMDVDVEIPASTEKEVEKTQAEQKSEEKPEEQPEEKVDAMDVDIPDATPVPSTKELPPTTETQAEAETTAAPVVSNGVVVNGV